MRRIDLGMAVVFLLGMTPGVISAQGEGAMEVVDSMIETHGGMDPWVSAPTVAFTDTWFTGNNAEGSSSRVVVEQGARRAYIENMGTDSHMAWDGEKAWSVNWTSPTPPRFLALLNYYFLNLPWLVKDPGVVLGEPGTATLWEDPIEYITIRVTYESGVGDTPEDYYVLYIHPETHRLRACEYVVTYADLLPPEMNHTPPKFLIYEDYETVDGLLVPVRFVIYEEDHAEYARCEVGDWSFRGTFDTTRMVMPQDAKLDTSRPTRDGN